MSSVTPLIVTYPCALVRDGLRPILAKSPFRPVHILPTLNEETESYLASAGACIWLLGVNECGPTTNDLVRRVVATNPRLKPVILTRASIPRMTYCRICGRRPWLPRSRHSQQAAHQVLGIDRTRRIGDASLLSANGPHIARRDRRVREVAAQGEFSVEGRNASIQLFPPRLADLRWSAGDLRAPAGEQAMPGNEVVRSLSRRELVILRTLTEGASNKIIARKLVITELTVKVHMKAILRKLRLQNRTQAAIWARTHLGALLENAAA